MLLLNCFDMDRVVGIKLQERFDKPKEAEKWFEVKKESKDIEDNVFELLWNDFRKRFSKGQNNYLDMQKSESIKRKNLIIEEKLRKHTLDSL